MAVIRDYIDSQFSNDQKDEVGIGGFTTFAKIRENISLSSDAPTVFLEDGSHVNDHIIRNPLLLSIQGSVSDVHLRQSPALEAVQELNNVIGLVTQYLPTRTQAQVSKVNSLIADFTNTVDAVDAAIDASQRVARYLGFLGAEKSNVEKFIDTMEAIHNTDALVKIDAPFRTYENMRITLFEWEKDNTTDAINFTIDAQQFRFADVIFTKLSAPKPSSAVSGQTSDVVDKGVQSGVDATNQEQSLLSSILN